MPNDQTTISVPHEISRVRHDLKCRMLRVSHVRRLSPKMVRVTLTGDDLAGFVSAGFDDHVKLFFPPEGSEKPVLPTLGANGPVFPEGAERPDRRDYTPRSYDAARNELAIDFALHESGPATKWAESAEPGQFLGVAGPRGSFVVPVDFDWHLLVGDETALPAIGRRLEELPAGTRAIVVAEVDGPADEIALTSAAPLDIRWVHRQGRAPGEPALLDRSVGELALPQGEGYAWVACESDVAKALRRRLLDQHGLPRQWVKAAGYWKRGAVASHERIED